MYPPQLSACTAAALLALHISCFAQGTPATGAMGANQVQPVDLRVGAVRSANSQDNITDGGLLTAPTAIPVGPAVPLAKDYKVGPNDLLDHNCLSVQPSPGGEPTSWYYRIPGGAKELKVTGNLAVNDAHMVHQAVVAGLGIGLLPAWIVAEDLAADRVTRILPNVEMTQAVFDHGFYAVFRRSELILPRIRVFIDFMIDTFRRKDAEISRIAMIARRQSAETDRRAPDAMRWIHPQGLHRG